MAPLGRFSAAPLRCSAPFGAENFGTVRSAQLNRFYATLLRVLPIGWVTVLMNRNGFFGRESTFRENKFLLPWEFCKQRVLLGGYYTDKQEEAVKRRLSLSLRLAAVNSTEKKSIKRKCAAIFEKATANSPLFRVKQTVQNKTLRHPSRAGRFRPKT